MGPQPSIASAAFLIADPTRAMMLIALLDGRARPAGELAYAAGVTAQTASSHLAKLLAGGLLVVEAEGRHTAIIIWPVRMSPKRSKTLPASARRRLHGEKPCRGRRRNSSSPAVAMTILRAGSVLPSRAGFRSKGSSLRQPRNSSKLRQPERHGSSAWGWT